MKKVIIFVLSATIVQLGNAQLAEFQKPATIDVVLSEGELTDLNAKLTNLEPAQLTQTVLNLANLGSQVLQTLQAITTATTLEEVQVLIKNLHDTEIPLSFKKALYKLDFPGKFAELIKIDVGPNPGAVDVRPAVTA